MPQNNQIQPNVDEVINSLAQQVAQLTTDNAIATSIINQLKIKVNELQVELDKAE